MKTLFKIVLITMLSSSIFSKTIKLKVGVLAPEGTTWAKVLKKMGKEVKKSTEGRVKFKFSFNGTQGDEKDVLRKIRIGSRFGQMQGGVFTGKTLGEINGNVRVLEIPFLFGSNRGLANKTMIKLSPFFTKQLEKSNFHNLGFFEIGLVYFVSQKETKSLDDLKGIKIWSWEGDQIVDTMIKSMKLIAIPLPITDVLTSLSTNAIGAAYAPPMGIIALQWNSKIKYLVDFPIAYSVGAFLISKRAWNQVNKSDQKIINEISKRFMNEVNDANKKDNISSLEAIKDQGVKFLKFTTKDEEKAKTLKKTIISKLRGKLFTNEALNKLNKALGK